MTVGEMAAASGVAFGTSGVRGLVTRMTDRVCYAYTAGFLRYLGLRGQRVGIAGDLRPSTGRVMAAVMQACLDEGYQPVHCGRIPSPAILYYGVQQHIPTIMVTGSHIPDDRNGIKFATPAGELMKEDEPGLLAQEVPLPDIFDANEMLRATPDLGPVDPAAREGYLRRYRDAFPADLLAGMRLGLYQHSAVGRDLLQELYTALGAEIEILGRSEAFIPVDTEAIRQEDKDLAAGWAQEGHFTAILATDGDSDRPLVSDEHGEWLRGDLLGILCARFCGAEVVVTPVSSNTAVERCGWFREVRRTRIGSPYVIAAMQAAVKDGAQVVVGYEANGGFLTATPVQVDGRQLAPLLTRDPVIIHLALLALSRQLDQPISQLAALLPPRVTASDRITDVPQAEVRRYLQVLTEPNSAALTQLAAGVGTVTNIDQTDGVRITFDSDDIIHLRPSGNAPELRCYAEATTQDRAEAMVRHGLQRFTAWRAQQ